jgi:hypothetical protein
VKAMQWVDRLQEVTGWQEPWWECDWRSVESDLGTALPGDYKELCDRFGPGYFSDYIRVMFDRGEESLLSWWKSELALFRSRPSDIYDPYVLYGYRGRAGLIQWCSSEWGSFFWLADSEVNPNNWPVMAKLEMGPEGKWYRFDFSVSEFIYHAIADPEFKPFSVAGPKCHPAFSRYDPNNDPDY